MYPAAFDYYRATSVSEAIQMLQQHPDAKLIAGGHSLLPLMKLRLASPPALIDICRISGLSGVHVEAERATIGPGTPHETRPVGWPSHLVGGQIVVGALTTYYDLMRSADIQRSLPLIAEAAALVGDLQVRNRGTIGGSIAHADPASDLPAVILALDADITAAGPSGERTIQATDFFVDLLTTDLQPDEVVTKITFPRPAGRTGTAYEKFKHPASGYAVVGAAAVVTLGADGRAELVRVGISGAGSKAVRATAVEQALTGQQLTPEAIKNASAHAADGIDLNGDIFASPEYRGHLTQVYAARALERAAARARG